MAFDARCPFGGDLSVASQPDVALIGVRTADFDFLTDRDELIQRLIRRLLTSKGEWIPFPTYGGNLRLYVDEALDSGAVSRIKADCLAQIQQEPDIADQPPPEILISQIPDGLVLTIKVTTRTLQQLTFTFNPKTVG